MSDRCANSSGAVSSLCTIGGVGGTGGAGGEIAETKDSKSWRETDLHAAANAAVQAVLSPSIILPNAALNSAWLLL